MERLQSWFAQVRRLLHLIPWTLGLLWQSHKAATIGVCLLTVVQGLIPLAQLWITKLLVDQVVLLLTFPVGAEPAGAINIALSYVGYEAGLLILGFVLGTARAHLHNILQEHLLYHVQMTILAKSTSLDLAAFEDPEYYDQLARANQGATYGPVELLESMLTMGQTIIALLSSAALIIAYQPWVLPLLVLTTLPSFWALFRYGQKRFFLFNTRTPDGRRAEYLSAVLASDLFAKEIRLWGITNYLTRQIQALRLRFRRENIALSQWQSIFTLGGELLSSLGYYAAYFSVVLATVSRQLTVGDLTLYAGLFSRTQSLFEEFLQLTARIYEVQLFAEQLEAFLQLEPTIVAPPVPTPLVSRQHDITFRDFAFSYPGAQEPVFHNLNLHLRAGECVALVGTNGAGKTTLVKCLLRLYDPTSGSITVDGHDLRSFDPEVWRSSIGVIFQDYAKYQLTVRENIGVGNLDALDDMPRLQHVARQAGIDTLIEQMPDGFDTLLGRRFEGGVELSLGQWQRIALARALLRDSHLLILDEPTAAMDPQAEYEMYQHFRELAQGRTTLLISHRFSTVRMADRILVLEDGDIIEEGTHDELLAQAGRYAHLFHLQAESYQLAA